MESSCKSGIQCSGFRQRARLWTLNFGLWALLLGGCAVGPNYRRPPVIEPVAFRGETRVATNSLAELPWWQVFHDDALQNLIRVALTNNYDVRIAVTRVEQARAIAAETRAQLFPQLNYTGLVGNTKNIGSSGTPLVNGVSGTSGISGTSGSGNSSGSSATFSLADANASWEIDLFGRIRRLTESARAQFFATEEAQRDVTAALIAQVAQDYFQLLALDRELAIAKSTTNSYGQSLNIFNERLRGGVASRLETASAIALLSSTAATIPDLERLIVLQENQLSVLLGQSPQAIPRDGSRLENQAPPDVPAGLPSALLERRPDIREAEQLLRSANAQVGVATANFFPQLTLTGLFGRVSPGLSVFTAGGATAWSGIANLTGPIFQGGRLRAQYRQAIAAREQSAVQYQATVLYALQEVSNALVAREKFAEARVQQTRAVEAYREAARISIERYRLGQSSYYEVLQEQQLLFPAENALAQTQFNQLVTIIQLYRALGGGWQTGR
ncbi:MAG: efflux system, outer rane lipoprotein NodT family [Pedosphaera sp.]|nr:efflux system, outer rane lipoprotein NodT family [Pedosphaera sp.]